MYTYMKGARGRRGGRVRVRPKPESAVCRYAESQGEPLV